MLQYMAQINDNQFSYPKIDIVGLTFAERLNIDTNIKEFINELWNSSDLKKIED